MGLITKEVEVCVCGNKQKYYESLGYNIPREKNNNGRMRVPRGSKIKVKVEHLSEKSGIRVDVECDCCHSMLNIPYYLYQLGSHNGKYYCNHCNKKHGENHPNWNPNKTDEERIRGRQYPEYYEFIQKVLARDFYTCQCCGKKNGVVLEVHHLDGYDWCVEKRTDETNGVTLCEDCHKSFHSIYKCGNNTKEQFEEWIGKTMKLLEFDGTLALKRQVICHETQKIYSYAVECAEDIGCRRSEVYDCCNHKNHSLYKKHYFWLDEYQSLSSSEIDEYVNYKNTTNAKQIICITTGKIFKSTTYASQCYNIKTTYNILKCCKNMPKNKHCGKLSDGTPLKWMYYEDFLKLPQEEQNEILERNKDSSTDGSFIDYKTNNERTGEFND